MSAEEFDEWCLYHQQFPLDDQSNFHYPIAQLEATLININRAQSTPPVSFQDRLMFKPRKERSFEDILQSEDF